MDGYQFQLRCRWCGEECAHVTNGNDSAFDARAIAKCNGCGTSWLVIVQLVDPSGGRAKQTTARTGQRAKARDTRWHRA